MENKVVYSDKDEEIDLAGLFKKGWGLFKKRQKLFWVFIIVGIILGIVYYNLMPRTYKSRMIISSSVFQGPSFVLILDDLQILLKEKNYEELASLLGIDVATAKMIDKIEVYSSKNYAEQSYGDKVSFEDEEDMKRDEKKEKKEEFVIEAFVDDNSVFKVLEKGIVHYLNSNPSIKENSLNKKKALSEMKVNIGKQRIELDSLKNSIAFILSKQSVPRDFFIGEPGAMYTDMLKLYEAELKAADELFASDISIIENFRIYKKQHSPRLGMTLIIFTLTAGFLYLVTIIYLESKS